MVSLLKDNITALPGNCNFEDDGLCGWDLNAANDDFNWIVAQGKTGSFGTGPDADHTLGITAPPYRPSVNRLPPIPPLC